MNRSSRDDGSLLSSLLNDESFNTSLTVNVRQQGAQRFVRVNPGVAHVNGHYVKVKEVIESANINYTPCYVYIRITPGTTNTFTGTIAAGTYDYEPNTFQIVYSNAVLPTGQNIYNGADTFVNFLLATIATITTTPVITMTTNTRSNYFASDVPAPPIGSVQIGLSAAQANAQYAGTTWVDLPDMGDGYYWRLCYNSLGYYNTFGQTVFTQLSPGPHGHPMNHDHPTSWNTAHGHTINHTHTFSHTHTSAMHQHALTNPGDPQVQYIQGSLGSTNGRGTPYAVGFTATNETHGINDVRVTDVTASSEFLEVGTTTIVPLLADATLSNYSTILLATNNNGAATTGTYTTAQTWNANSIPHWKTWACHRIS